MTKLIIDIHNDTVRVFLEEKEAVLDEINFPLGHDLSKKLLPAIEEILKNGHLEPKDIEKAEFRGEMNESHTTYRIAKAVEQAFNWAIAYK